MSCACNAHESKTVIAAVVFTWLWQNTNSVLLPILMHASHQNSVRFIGRVFADGDAAQLQWIVTVIWLVVAVGILVTYGAQSFSKITARDRGL